MIVERDISGLLEKAKESLKGAEVLFKEGFFDFSASRSYYAMFYTAEALLLTKKLAFSKHSGVISAFGKEFVKSGIFPQKLRDYFIDAFEDRQLGDYGIHGSIEKDKAKLLMKHANEFIKKAEEYLRKERYKI